MGAFTLSDYLEQIFSLSPEFRRQGKQKHSSVFNNQVKALVNEVLL